jgi:hypothetical protein
MPSSLPPEILDLILEDLGNEPTALRTCCLVSKSWLPRTRKILFAHVHFFNGKSHIELWKKAFPDPSNSPASYTRTLFIRDLLTITAADAGVGGWIHPFHHLVRLSLDTFGYEDRQVSLVPLHGLSPILESLTISHTHIPPSEVFGLVCSFPLLDDLGLVSCNNWGNTDGWDAPPTSPKLTGSLNLRSPGGIRPIARQLCDLPNSLHFKEITVGCPGEDVESIMDLLSTCSGTLESIGINFYLTGVFPPAPLFGPPLTTTCRHRSI